jgi:hypothetical protein
VCEVRTKARLTKSKQWEGIDKRRKAAGHCSCARDLTKQDFVSDDRVLLDEARRSEGSRERGGHGRRVVGGGWATRLG